MQSACHPFLKTGTFSHARLKSYMAHFSAQARKIRKLKKIPLWKNFLYSPFSNFSLYFGKLNFLVSNLKKLIFFQKKIFLKFQVGTCKAWKAKKKSTLKKFFLQKSVFPYFGMLMLMQTDADAHADETLK